MIERISNQHYEATRVAPTEKISPVKGEDLLKSMDQQKEKPKREFSREKMEEVVRGLNDFIQPARTSIQFELHERLNDYFVKVVDAETKETIKEIPSSKLLDAYADMLEFVGILVDRRI